MSRSELYVDPEAFEWHESTLLDVNELDQLERPILDIVEAMGSPMRDVVELIAFGGYSKAETARTLGLSEPWIHKLWRRAKKELADALQNVDPLGPL